MRVIVCGGRDFTDERMLYAALDRLHAKSPITLVIEGGALGADRLAHWWAKRRKVPHQQFRADWSQGMSAGPKRNGRMLSEGKPDAVVAFAGGRGTADMVRQSTKAGVPVFAGEDL